MIEIKVKNMMGTDCVETINRVIKETFPHAVVQIDLARHLVCAEKTCDPEVLKRIIREIGYTPTQIMNGTVSPIVDPIGSYSRWWRTENLRKKITVDWSQRESVCASLRGGIGRGILRKYKHPPIWSWRRLSWYCSRQRLWERRRGGVNGGRSVIGSLTEILWLDGRFLLAAIGSKSVLKRYCHKWTVPLKFRAV